MHRRDDDDDDKDDECRRVFQVVRSSVRCDLAVAMMMI